jgi:hypothetical protein
MLGVNGNVQPRRHFLFELLQVNSDSQRFLTFFFDDSRQILDSPIAVVRKNSAGGG